MNFDDPYVAERLTRIRYNGAADELAVQGAALHSVPSSVRIRLKLADKATKHLHVLVMHTLETRDRLLKATYKTPKHQFG